MKDINPIDFGAHGDGVSDDRVAIQAALDSASPGDAVILQQLPSGAPYLVGNANAFACLSIPAGVELTSDGNVRILAAPGIPGGVRIIDIDAPSAFVSHLILDGNKALQTTRTEHMHGLMTRGANTWIHDISVVNCCGDGLYVYNGAFDLRVESCNVALCDRHGMTLSGTWDRGLLKDCRFTDNKVNQIHTESGLINSVIMVGNLASKSVPTTDYMVTIGGLAPDQRSKDWLVTDNQFYGGILVGWADDISIFSNKSNNTSVRPCVTVQRTCKNIRIYENDFVMNQTTDQATGVIAVTGTAEGGPERVIIEDNNLTALGHPHSFGVRCEGAVSVQVIDNRINGPGIYVPPAGTEHGSTGSAGVYARATSPDRPFASVLVLNNRIRDFGQFAVAIMGNGIAEMTRLDVIGNVFDDRSAGTMTTGISLDPCVKDLTIGDNVLSGWCTMECTPNPPMPAADEVPPRTFPPHRWIRS